MTVGTGSRIAGRYLLGERLGRGGMADVFRAEDERLGRTVAVKLLRDHAESSSDRDRFAAEARTLAVLDHPSIVTLLDAGLEDDQPWLAMQMVEGSTLATHLTGRPIRVAEVASIGRQLAEGLAYAHANGIVHRDVKPANVLLTEDGRALLADFGIARLLDSTTRHTVAGQAIGSPAYLAPEQASGGELSGAADVYSLGLLLLEALTGQRAFTGTTTEVVYARLQAPPEVPSSVPSGWAALLRAMTALAPADRPVAEEVGRRLAAFDGTDLAPLSPGAVDPEATAPFDVSAVGIDADPEGTRVISGPHATRVPGVASAAGVRERIRRLPPAAVAVGAALAALAVVLLVWLVLRDPATTTQPDVPAVPSGVPSHLQDELSDLHDAIHGSPR